MDRAAGPSNPTLHTQDSPQHRECVCARVTCEAEQGVCPWGKHESIAHQEMCSMYD